MAILNWEEAIIPAPLASYPQMVKLQMAFLYRICKKRITLKSIEDLEKQ